MKIAIFTSVLAAFSEALTILGIVLDSVPSVPNPIPPFFFAAAFEDLVTKLKVVLNMIMLFGFLYGTIRIISGAGQIRRGEYEEGKMSIVSGALIAAAPLIMRILFEIFFPGGGL